MKRIFALLLAVIVVLALCGCGGKSLKETAVMGKWISHGRTDSQGETEYTLIFFEDGTVRETYLFFGKEVSNTYKWSASGDTITLRLGILTQKLSFSADNGDEKLMASQADGYWYEHIVE